METAYDLWAKGLSGSHHVWGKIELDRSGKVEMIIFPHVKYRFLNTLGNMVGIGHLDQQLRILFNLDQFDILYSPYSAANTKLLLFLKWIGLFKKPIVVTIHQPFWGAKSSNRIISFLSKKFLEQYEACIFLSEPLLGKTMKTLKISEKHKKERFTVTQWGPDIAFFNKYRKQVVPFSECGYFISAGHTARDFETLIEAFRGLDYQLKIFCTPTSIPNVKQIPDNVEVNWEITFSNDLVEWYRKSIAILIPLKYPRENEGCQGMTSLQDVVAFGKPVIMTRNPTLNLDVEKEGFGFYVDMYDVEGWKKKLGLLHDNEELWNAMSEKASHVFKNKFNSRIFSDHLENVFESVYNDYLTRQSGSVREKASTTVL